MNAKKSEIQFWGKNETCKFIQVHFSDISSLSIDNFIIKLQYKEYLIFYPLCAEQKNRR